MSSQKTFDFDFGVRCILTKNIEFQLRLNADKTLRNELQLLFGKTTDFVGYCFSLKERLQKFTRTDRSRCTLPVGTMVGLLACGFLSLIILNSGSRSEGLPFKRNWTTLSPVSKPAVAFKLYSNSSLKVASTARGMTCDKTKLSVRLRKINNPFHRRRRDVQ